jgi:hypothetical protein
MLKPIVIQYWRDPRGCFYAESFDYPIAASGESLVQLKDHIARQIRECFQPGPIPAIYDLIPRAEVAVGRPAGPKDYSSAACRES